LFIFAAEKYKRNMMIQHIKIVERAAFPQQAKTVD
jgi:hypothetical protein